MSHSRLQGILIFMVRASITEGIWSLVRPRLLLKSLLKRADQVSLDLGFLSGKFIVLGRLPVVGNETIFRASVQHAKGANLPLGSFKRKS